MRTKFIPILWALTTLGALFLFAWPEDLQNDDAGQVQSDIFKAPAQGIPTCPRDYQSARFPLPFVLADKTLSAQTRCCETATVSPTLESISTTVLLC
jgi:hypothetical protein